MGEHKYGSPEAEPAVSSKPKAKDDKAKADSDNNERAPKRRKAAGATLERGIMQIQQVGDGYYLIDEWGQQVERLGDKDTFDVTAYLDQRSRRPRRAASASCSK
jgi:hypothetical protein